MALVRTGYGVAGERIPLRAALAASARGATGCYLVAAMADSPVLPLGGLRPVLLVCTVIPLTYALAVLALRPAGNIRKQGAAGREAP